MNNNTNNMTTIRTYIVTCLKTGSVATHAGLSPTQLSFGQITAAAIANGYATPRMEWNPHPEDYRVVELPQTPPTDRMLANLTIEARAALNKCEPIWDEVREHWLTIRMVTKVYGMDAHDTITWLSHLRTVNPEIIDLLCECFGWQPIT